jgi:hypothetical protein
VIRHRSKAGPRSPDWDQLVDLRPRRLKAGRDFDGSVKAFVREAQRVAAERGMVVRTARDRSDPEKCVWLQFAAGIIGQGDPCPCGGLTLRRIHPNFARCETCGAQLVVEAAAPSPIAAGQASPGMTRGQSKKGLGRYTFVRLTRYEEGPAFARYAGEAVDPEGVPVVLLVTEPRIGGEPIPDPTSPTGRAHKVFAVIPKAALTGVEMRDIPTSDGWDLILD